MPGNADYFNEGRRREPKYKSKKVFTQEGWFDSSLEYRRWCFLKLAETDGAISDLQRQVKYELIPSQNYEGKHAERAVTYSADFVYRKGGDLVYEDAKSPATRTKDYIIKRKLMLFIHGIKLREVEKANEPI